MQVLRLGGLDTTNDVDACRRVLVSSHEMVLREVEGGIQLIWHSVKIRPLGPMVEVQLVAPVPCITQEGD